MDAGAVFAQVQADRDDYLIDLDTDAGVEDFDFKLDGVYEIGAVDASMEPEAGHIADRGPDIESGHGNEEVQDVPAVDEQTEINEEAPGINAEIGMNYQDEIGYEDEESALPEDAKDSTEEVGVSTPGQPAGISDEAYAEQDFLGYGTEVQDDAQGATDQDQELDASGEELQEDLPGDQDGGHASHEHDVGDPGVETSAEESTHPSLPDNGRTPASNFDDAENATSNASDTSSILPEIVVHYNQGQYSLLGTPGDDPDSYFLSDEKDLDGSLSQLLSSIRAVISNEVSAVDELFIRIDSLDFEFGEKSSTKFLGRPFRDIITCFTALAAKPSRLAPKDSSTLDLELLVRRDCEERFLELLADAGFAGQGRDQSSHQGDYEAADEATSSGQAHDESSADEYSEEYELETDAAAAAASAASAASAAASDVEDDLSADDGGEGSLEFPEASENLDDTMGDVFDLELGMLEPTELTGPGVSGMDGAEGHYDGDQHESYGGVDGAGRIEEIVEDGFVEHDVDISADLDGEFAPNQTNDVSGFVTDALEPAGEGAVKDGWHEEVGAGGSLDGGETITNVVGTTVEQGSNPNDDDFALILDSDSGLPTTLGQNGDTSTPSDNLAQVPADSPHQISNTSHGDGFAQAHAPSPNYTSRTSTINGDNTETQSLFAGHSIVDTDPQQDSRVDVGRDEIDWENDGDENEGQSQLAQTPNSVSGKRSRTNEPESLDDEADYKRRRT